MYAQCAAAADSAHQPPADTLISVVMDAQPSDMELRHATRNHGADTQSFMPQPDDQPTPYDTDNSRAKSSSSSPLHESMVFTPIPDSIADDDLPLVLNFDGGLTRQPVPHPTQQQSGSDSAKPIGMAHASASASNSLPVRSHVTSFTTMVLRLSRRVSSVGMWQPTSQTNTRTRKRYRQYGYEEEDVIENENELDESPVTPPTTPPTVFTSTLNLLLTAGYVRTGCNVPEHDKQPIPSTPSTSTVDTEAEAETATETVTVSGSSRATSCAASASYRSIDFHVLPGPSFQRGSLSALSERFGPEATGFEPRWYGLRDFRHINSAERERDTSDDGSVGGNGHGHGHGHGANTGSRIHTHRLPGDGPIHHLRTVTGQQNENWIFFLSGHSSTKPDMKDGDSDADAFQQVSLYGLQVQTWTDPQLAKQQSLAFEAATKRAEEHDSSAPRARKPVASYNAMGVRIRVTNDLEIGPVLRGQAIKRPTPKEEHDDAEDAEAEDEEEHGLDDSTRGSKRSAETAQTEHTPSYARIVDFAAYQQKHHLFLTLAYDDGWVRTYGRGGVLRNEIHTRNETVLQVANSHWGSASTSTISVGGVGARGRGSMSAAAPDMPLNGQASGGNQALAYVTPSGIGLVRVTRIYPEIDQYCRWEGSLVIDGGDGGGGYASSGVRSGHDISAVAFDGAAQNIMYVLAHHPSPTLFVLNTNLVGGYHSPGSRVSGRGMPSVGRYIHPLGNPCRFTMSLPLRFGVDGLSSASTSSSSPASFRSPHPLPPFVMSSAWRGLLIVASAESKSMQVFNTSSMSKLSGSGTHARTIMFLMERQIGSIMGEQHGPASNQHHHRPPLQLSLDRLVADRIDMLFAGGIARCDLSVDACTDDNLPSGSRAPSSSSSSLIHMFQSYLPQSPEPRSSFSFNFTLSSLGRFPLFILGIFTMLGIQWWKKRSLAQKLMKQQEREFARKMRAMEGRGESVGVGAVGRHDTMQGRRSIPAGAFDDPSNASAEGAPVSLGEDGWDEQTFMREFMEWRQSEAGQAVCDAAAGVSVNTQMQLQTRPGRRDLGLNSPSHQRQRQHRVGERLLDAIEREGGGSLRRFISKTPPVGQTRPGELGLPRPRPNLVAMSTTSQQARRMRHQQQRPYGPAMGVRPVIGARTASMQSSESSVQYDEQLDEMSAWNDSFGTETMPPEPSGLRRRRKPGGGGNAPSHDAASAGVSTRANHDSAMSDQVDGGEDYADNQEQQQFTEEEEHAYDDETTPYEHMHEATLQQGYAELTASYDASTNMSQEMDDGVEEDDADMNGDYSDYQYDRAEFMQAEVDDSMEHALAMKSYPVDDVVLEEDDEEYDAEAEAYGDGGDDDGDGDDLATASYNDDQLDIVQNDGDDGDGDDDDEYDNTGHTSDSALDQYQGLDREDRDDGDDMNHPNGHDELSTQEDDSMEQQEQHGEKPR